MMREKINLLWSLLFMIGGINIYAQSLNNDLKLLINSGLEYNHQKKINQYSIEQTKLEKKNLWNNYLPKLTLNTTYTRLDDDIKLDSDLEQLLIGTQKLLIKEAIGLPFNSSLPPQIPIKDIPVIQQKNILKSSLDAEWLLFSGLKIEQANQALKHKEKAQVYKNQLIDEKITEKIIRTYQQLALVQSSMDVLKITEKYLEKQNDFVLKAKKNGWAIELDLQKIALAQQKLKIKQLTVKNNKKLLLASLQQLTGLPISQLKQMNFSLNEMILNKESLAEGKRSEIEALNEKIKAEKYQQKAELASYLPKIAIQGHYELRDEDLTMFDPKWYVGVGLKWNFFDGFKSWNQAKKIKLENKKTKEKLQEAKELISLEKLQAKQNYEMALEKIKQVKKQISLSEYNYRLTQKQYKNGLTDTRELLKSIQDLKMAKLDLTKALFEENQAAIQYLKSNGNLLKFIK